MTVLDPIDENNAQNKATAEIKGETEVVVSRNCVVCGKPLNYGRLFVCKECEPCMDFVSRYVKAETFKEIAKCFIAKVLHAHVITPLGRIMLLPKDYNRLAIATGNEDMI